MAVIVELTSRLRRWSKIPNQNILLNAPPSNSHFRLVLAVTADVPEEEVMNLVSDYVGDRSLRCSNYATLSTFIHDALFLSSCSLHDLKSHHTICKSAENSLLCGL